MLPTLLIVDDEKATLDGLRAALDDSFDCYIAADAASALTVLKSEPVDVMLTDLRLGGDSGMDLLDKALALPKPPVAVMMTAYGSVDTAVEAMRRGAWHFVTKPLNLDEVEMLLKRAVRSRSLESENRELRKQVGRTVPTRPADRQVGGDEAGLRDGRASGADPRHGADRGGDRAPARNWWPTPSTICRGRPAEKLVIVHCAALSPQLLESELFGHEKGSFTGAVQRRIGRFEQADGGTLFLDEIGEIDAATQVKLLRALRAHDRAGGLEHAAQGGSAGDRRHQPEPARVGRPRRVSARTCISGSTWCGSQMPPLRSRGEDMVLLANEFLQGVRRGKRPAGQAVDRRGAAACCAPTRGRATCASCAPRSSTAWS